MPHTPGWQDEQMASLLCEGVDQEQIVVTDEWRLCGRCGKEVRLVWRVSVEERPAP